MSDPGLPKESDPRKAVTEQIRGEIQKRLEPVPQLKNLPEPTKAVVMEQVTEVAIAVSHSTWDSSFPPPSIIQEYEQIEPGLASRIFRMAEEDFAHSRSMDQRLADYIDRGQAFGFVLAAVAIISGAYLVSIGERLLGGLFSATVLIPIVTLFVKGHVKLGGSAGGNGDDAKTTNQSSKPTDERRPPKARTPKRRR